jgi:hypothetical protein
MSISMRPNVTRIGTRLRCALAALVGAGALAAAVSGCGSSGVTLDPVAQAASTTFAAGGVHMQVAIQVSSSSLPAPVVGTGQGVFNYKTREGTFTLQMTGLPASAGSATPGSTQIEELMKPSALYVGSPLFAGRLPGGARWIKIDLARVSSALGMNLEGVTNGQSNPAEFLEYLRAHGANVTKLGTEVVQGVDTTRYHSEIELKKLVQTLPAAQRAKAQPAIEKLSQESGLTTIPFDVWIDRNHLVRKISLSFSTNTAGQSVKEQTTVELSGFGPTPAVTAPPESEVYDATSAALSGLAAQGVGSPG